MHTIKRIFLGFLAMIVVVFLYLLANSAPTKEKTKQSSSAQTVKHIQKSTVHIDKRDDTTENVKKMDIKTEMAVANKSSERTIRNETKVFEESEENRPSEEVADEEDTGEAISYRHMTDEELIKRDAWVLKQHPDMGIAEEISEADLGLEKGPPIAIQSYTKDEK